MQQPARRTLLKAGLGATTAALVAGAGQALTAAPAHAQDDDLSWIIDCDGWGARPPTGEPSLSDAATNKIIIHHMAFPNVTDYSREQAIRLARDCQDLHMDDNGWVDTGQHFTVSRGGYVLEGRHRSLETLESGDRQVIAAHCPGENGRAIGIENEGTYVSETPPQALLDSLVRLCVTICRRYGLHAHDMFGHWDFRATACPGVMFYGLFPMLRRQVASALGTPSADIPLRRWPDVWRFVGGPVVQIVQYLLNNQGYDLAVDGDFGPLTTAAVQDWQARQGLPVDPDATLTPETWESLVVDLGVGDTGPAVDALQFILADRGFGAERSGTFDEPTLAAVEDLQRLHGLSPSGTVDTSTWCAAAGGIVRESFDA